MRERILAHIARYEQLAYHYDRDSRMSRMKGFPDLLVVGPGGLLVAELKTQDGRLSPDQTRWRYTLQAVGITWLLWRPMDWQEGTIQAELDTLAQAPGSSR